MSLIYKEILKSIQKDEHIYSWLLIHSLHNSQSSIFKTQI